MGGKIDAKALALAGGISWSAGVFLAGIGSMFIPGWATAVNWLGQFYIGYAPTVTGSVIGGVWAFLDLSIGLYVFASLYNWFRDNL